MNKIFLLTLLIIGGVSCGDSDKTNKNNPKEKVHFEDNVELQKMHDEDQSDRRPESGEIDWEVVLVRDSLRLAKAFEMVESEEVHTAKDYYNAAIIFQHGYDTLASGMAVKMMEKAVELDPSTNKWLLAAAIDRDKMRKEEPQVFGTQFSQDENGVWGLYLIDTTLVNDSIRREYGVASLTALKTEAEKMNNRGK